jgi:hypothetical protein
MVGRSAAAKEETMTETKKRLVGEWERKWEEMLQLHLEVEIEREAVSILDGAGLDRDAAAALGMTPQQVFALARERVLQRVSWKPKDDAP